MEREKHSLVRVLPVRQEKGSVLILTLWALLFLGMLVVAVSAHVAGVIRVAEGIANRTQAVMATRSGAAAAVNVAVAFTNSYAALDDEWADNPAAFENVQIGGGYYRIVGTPYADNPTMRFGLDDEQGKINLNNLRVGLDLLRTVFMQIGGVTDKNQAEELAAALLEWRDESEESKHGGQDGSYYQSLDPPYEPRNGALQSVEELMLIKGMTPEIYRRVLPYVTALPPDRQININTASEKVLECLARAVDNEKAGAARSLAGKITTYIRAGGRFENPGLGAMANALNNTGYNLSTDERTLFSGVVARYLIVGTYTFRGRVEGYAGRAEEHQDGLSPDYVVEFVFDCKGHKMLYWREF